MVGSHFSHLVCDLCQEIMQGRERIGGSSPKNQNIVSGGLVGTLALCATLEELYTERTGPQTHSDRIHTVYLDESRPKIYRLFSHLIDEKFASFLTYLESC